MIQMDASSFELIDNEVLHLHVAIDDADGKIVDAYFDIQETLKGYYNVLYHCFTLMDALFLNIKEKQCIRR